MLVNGAKLAACAVAAVAIWLCGVGAGPGGAPGRVAPRVRVPSLEASPAPPPGYIVYSSLRNGRWRVVRMKSDGSGATLLRGRGNNTYPLWLPDGRILFNSDRSGKWQVYTMAWDGTGQTRVTDGTRNEEHAGVGGGGSLLLLREGPRTFRVRSLVTGVTKGLSFRKFTGTGGEIWPALSPDGARIAFLFKNGTGAARAVYRAAVRERARRFVVRPPAKAAVGCFNSWASDSTRFLMCIIDSDATGSDLYLIRERADGSWGKKRMTTAVNWDYFPAWSPDDSWITWAAAPLEGHDFSSPTYEIYAQPFDGTTPIRLTTDGFPDNAPSWGDPPTP